MKNLTRIPLIIFSVLFCICILAFAFLFEMQSPSRANALTDKEIKATAERVSDEGIVLLKNDVIEGQVKTLPFNSKMKIGLLGNGGSERGYITGGSGSTEVFSDKIIYPDQALTQAVEDGLLAGFELINKETSSKFDRVLYFINRTSCEDSDRTIDGYLLTQEEKNDITWLIDTFGKEKVVIILNVVAVTDTSWILSKDVGAIVCAYTPGERGAVSLVNILTGQLNPSGKLADTWAKSLEDYPTTHNFADSVNVSYYEDVYVGYRYFETFDSQHQKINFCFGFGLSYTTFEIKKSYVNVDEDNNVKLYVSVTNTGNVAGKEVVQVYFDTPNDLIDTPAKDLIAFEKTDLLQPNQTQTLEINFNLDDMAQVDDLGVIKKNTYVMQQGTYKIYVGNSVIDANSRVMYQHVEQTNRIIKEVSEIQSTLSQRITSDGTIDKVNPYVIKDGLVMIEAAVSDSHYNQSFPISQKHCMTKWEGNSFVRYIEYLAGTTFRYKLYVEKAGQYKLDFSLGAFASQTNNLNVFLDYTDDGIDNGENQNINITVTPAPSNRDTDFVLHKGYDINFTKTGWVTLYIVGGSLAPKVDYFVIYNNGINESGETQILATNTSSSSGVQAKSSVNGNCISNCKAGNFAEYTLNATKAGKYYLSLSASNVIKASQSACKVYVNGAITEDIKLMRTSANPREGATVDCDYRFKESSAVEVDLVEGQNVIRVEFTEDDVITNLNSIIIRDTKTNYVFFDNTELYDIKPEEAYKNTQNYEDLCTGSLSYKYAQVIDGEVSIEEFLRQLNANELMVFARLYWSQESNTNTGSFGANIYGQTLREIYEVPYANTADGSVGVRFTQSDGTWTNKTYQYSTWFPSLTTLASTWNKQLAKEYGEALAEECKKVNVHVILGPGVNIHRNPLSGRNFEYFSEDPILSGYMAANYIIGTESNGVMCSIKHMVCNEQETFRRFVNSSVSARALRQIYLKPFEIAVKLANPSTIMSSYNNVNGVPTWGDKTIITDIFRNEFGYLGTFEGDWDDDSNLPYMFNSGHNVLSMDHNDDKDYDKLLSLSYRQGDITYQQLLENAKNVMNLLIKSGASAITLDSGAPTFKAWGRIICEGGDGTLYEYLENKNIYNISETQSEVCIPNGVYGTANIKNQTVRDITSDSGAYYAIHVSTPGTYYISYILNVGANTNKYGSFEVFIDGEKVDTFTNPQKLRSTKKYADWATMTRFEGDNGQASIYLPVGMYRIYVKFYDGRIGFNKIIFSYEKPNVQGLAYNDGEIEIANYSTASSNVRIVEGNLAKIQQNDYVEYAINADNVYDVSLDYNLLVKDVRDSYFEVYLDGQKIETFANGIVSEQCNWYKGENVYRLEKGQHTLKILFLNDQIEVGGIRLNTLSFAGNKFKVSIDNDAEKGLILGADSNSYFEYNSDLKLTVKAKEGYKISSVKWNGQNQALPTDAVLYSFNVLKTDDDSLSVTYQTDSRPYYDVTLTNDDNKGSVTGLSTGRYVNAQHNVTVKAKEGYRIASVKWNGQNLQVTNDTEFTFTIMVDAPAQLTIEYVNEGANLLAIILGAVGGTLVLIGAGVVSFIIIKRRKGKVTE